jgi:hypothetical protein
MEAILPSTSWSQKESVSLSPNPPVQQLHAFRDCHRIPGRQQRVPMVKHDNKHCESDQLLCSIEAESRADFRSDAVINRRLARFEALSDKKNSRTLHLAVVAEIVGMRFCQRIGHAGPETRSQNGWRGFDSSVGVILRTFQEACRRRDGAFHIGSGVDYLGFNASIASGGTVTCSECGRPCQGKSSEGSPPAFPMFWPP